MGTVFYDVFYIEISLLLVKGLCVDKHSLMPDLTYRISENGKYEETDVAFFIDFGAGNRPGVSV